MPRLLSQPSRNVKPFRPACRSRKCTPRLFVPKNHLAASFGTDQSAAMSGGHRNATAPNSSASALRAVTIARYGADWQRLAMPGPRPNSIVIGEV